MGHTITAMWQLIVRDMEQTLDAACHLVLADARNTPVAAQRRAEALRDLGRMCQVRAVAAYRRRRNLLPKNNNAHF